MESERQRVLRFHFWERASGAVNLVLLAGLLGVPAALALASRVGALPAALSWLALAGLSLGARVRLTVSTEGYQVDTWQAWVLPTGRHRYLLDWTPGPFQSLEADAPEGLCLTPPRAFGEAETDCCGPTGPELERVLERLAAEVTRLRREVPLAPRTLTLSHHPEVAAALDVTGRTFHPESGRLATARLTRDVSIGDTRLPAGSTVHLNADGWLDPRRPDVLMRVTLSAPTVIAAPGPLSVPAEATIALDVRSGAVCGCSAADTFTALGLETRGPAQWDARGEWLELELAKAVTRGAFALPEGTRLRRLLPAHAFFAHLPAPLAHPELGPVRTLSLDAGLARVTAACIDGDVELDGLRLRGGVLPVPLDEAGRVDLRACRRSGLLSKPG